MCQNNDTPLETRKQELKAIITGGLNGNNKTTKTKPPKILKNIYVSWEHYDSKKERFAIVRAERGGGCSKLTFSINATKDEALQICGDHFWQRRKPQYFSDKEDYVFALADAKHELIQEMVGDSLFTIKNYCEYYKTSRTRLFLLTKKKCYFPELTRTEVTTEEEFRSGITSTHTITSTPQVRTSSSNSRSLSSNYSNDSTNTTNTSSISTTSNDSTSVNERVHSALIGTSAERANLAEQNNLAYNESLQMDIDKNELAAREEIQNDHQNELAIREEARLVSIRLSRQSRVSAEPSLQEEHALISVRHTSLGNKSRFFVPNQPMMHVYDWVGSLSTKPEHFEIVNYGGKVVLPHEQIEAGVFNMRVSDSPLQMSQDGEVAFLGFGVHKKDLTEAFSNLQKMKLEYSKNYNGETEVIIDRQNIYSDFIELYSSAKNIENTSVSFQFKDEDAVGDGITRDAFSCFFQAVYAKFDGENEVVPRQLLEDSELIVIGKVITNAFITQDVFPLKICRCSLLHCLFENATKEELIKSYLNYLPLHESNVIQQYSEGKDINKQIIIDIFSEHGIYTVPSQSNIMQLCNQAANISLIRLPFFAFQTIVKGMGAFWKNVTKEMLLAVYSCTTPDAEKIIACLQVEEENATDQKLTTWLHRYIRASSDSKIISLVRFITGSSSLLPDDVIKVNFVNQQVNHLRPTAATCFKILNLPRQFSSLTQMRQSIDFFISNEELWNVHDNIA